MGDSAPYQSDGENQAPRKHRYQQKSDKRIPRDNGSRDHGYLQERDENKGRKTDRIRMEEDHGPYHEKTQSRNQQRNPPRHQQRDHHHRERASTERSQNSHYNKDRYPDERDQAGDQRQRSNDRYKERDYEEKLQQRSQKDTSGNWYQEREKYFAERAPSRSQPEMSRNHERDGRHQHLYTVDPPMNRREDEFHYKSERSVGFEDVEYHEPAMEGGILDCNKCKYLCTGRGILQILEVVLNALVLICLVSSYFVLSGFSAGMTGGGFGMTNYPFEGQELQEVRQLDQQFTFLRAPLLYGGLAVSVLVGSLTLGVLAAGAKHLQSLSGAWLLAEAFFGVLASLGYGAAVGVFLHFALQINSTDLCKRRERLYARNGLSWMNCDLAGTDGGAATFGILLVILYGASVVLAARAYRERKAIGRMMAADCKLEDLG